MNQNQYTQQEKLASGEVVGCAAYEVMQYANAEDHKAAIVALLIEALILAGGQSFLKSTEEQS
jgi:hypothetical protein